MTIGVAIIMLAIGAKRVAIDTKIVAIDTKIVAIDTKIVDMTLVQTRFHLWILAI